MAGTARILAKMRVTGPLVATTQIELDAAEAVTNWSGPFTIQVPTGINEQSIIALGTQGLTTITDLWITSDQNVSITYGTANVNVPVPLNAGGVHCMGKTSLTALSVSNSSGVTAQLTYFTAGA